MAHKSRIGVLVIDCKSEGLDEAAGFWSRVFGVEARPDPKFPDYVSLDMPESEPCVLLQSVDHESRVHLDIETDDKEAEARRLEALGAKRLAAIKNWIVMQAPTGHRFCLVGPQRPGFESHATQWSDA